MGMRTIITLFLLLTTVSGFAQQQAAQPLKPSIRALPVGDPKYVNMSADTLSKLIQLIRTTPPNDFRGIVIIKGNELILEEYFNTYWRETIHDIRSAGKGITALLLGIAIDRGLVQNIDQSIYDFFPLAQRRADITIRHLLAMSSGMDADDDEASAGATSNWLTSEDWVSFALSLPMKFPPGEKYVYNDVCPMLVGAIIEETSGKKLADFAYENLFSPLGIREFYWYTAKNGRTGPMGNLYLTTLDFAKMGQLVLNKGEWDGKKVISSERIDEIISARFDISNEDPFATSYGHFWFKTTKQVNGRAFDCIYASGNGGNLLFVVPDENLVVSLTSSADGQGYGAQRSHNIFEYVLKSLVAR